MATAEAPQGSTADDSNELAGFGYKQELDRSLGSFSSFAAGFSYISILTGVTALYGFGYLNAGPGVWWTWPVVVFGQILVALCFMELAAQYPIAGSVYQWSKAALDWLHVVDDRVDLHRRRDRDDRRGRGRLAGRATADHHQPPVLRRPRRRRHVPDQGRGAERAAARGDPDRRSRRRSTCSASS